MNTNVTTVTTFLNSEQTDYASYSTIRAIASLIDGQKNSSRKVIYTTMNKLKGEVKVETFANEVASYTEYLHGSSSLNGVIVGLAQDYAGTNNLPILTREGAFGSRFSFGASAPRYIYTSKEKYFDSIFKNTDNEILVKQIFEGNQIEPRFYVPTLPLLLVNGSEGIATGFAQKILPRKTSNIIEYMMDLINDTELNESLLKPHLNGFKGDILPGINVNQWIICGKVEVISLTKLLITEIPYVYELSTYTDILDSLEENKIIKSYTDLSEDDIFKFEISVDSKIAKLDNDKILDLLKLKKPITENFTCINELNRIEEYTSAKEIIEHFYKIKSEYIIKRKDYILNTMKSKLDIMKSKYIFLKNILDGVLIINNKTKKEIIKEITPIKGILSIDGNYDYLVNMPLHSLSKETFDKLVQDLKALKAEYDAYKVKTEKDIFIEDIQNLKKELHEKV